MDFDDPYQGIGGWADVKNMFFLALLADVFPDIFGVDFISVWVPVLMQS